MRQRIRVNSKALAVSIAGLLSIAAFEGFRDEAYTPVPGDVLTIGYGHTGDVQPGDTVTREQALELLRTDASYAARGVAKCAPVPMYQYEFDTYVSFAYNVGTGAFCKSTMARKLNAGDYAGACAELTRWVYFKGRVLPGLMKRRQAEYNTCMGYDDAA